MIHTYSLAGILRRVSAALIPVAAAAGLASCDAVWGTSLDYSTDGYGNGLNVGLNLYPGSVYNGPYWWNSPGYIPGWSYSPAIAPVRPGISVRPPAWGGGATGNVRPPQQSNRPVPLPDNKPVISPNWNTNPGIQLPGNGAKPGEGFIQSKPTAPGSSGGSGMRPGR
ncbi:MAG: hypothetical protein NC043_04945 [Muribaculaceae bacterium]|nr:hypothetical protein [Muribaculaceae bacterium]